MGIGLWSKKDGLSIGLPVDIMQMLIPARFFQQEFAKSNPGKSPKVYLLIADSMAIDEGADRGAVYPDC